jgi:hypothetical protein
MLGRNNTLYSLAVTVDPDFHGHGVGRVLKEAQIRAAAGVRDAEGRARFRHLSGRTRRGYAKAMDLLNRSFGAYEVATVRGLYGAPDGEASYYRLPLGPCLPEGGTPAESEPIDLAAIACPFRRPPIILESARERGELYGPTVNKLTLCNYVTPAIVRAVEWVSALTPDLPHLYLTSSRDEVLDKCLRTIRFHRREAGAVVGLEGGYVGHTTAAARSLSDPSVHRQGPGYFRTFVRVSHPTMVGNASTITELHTAVEHAGGADRVLALVLEPVQECTGRTISDSFWDELATFRKDTGIPIVLIETASSFYRSGRGPFCSSGTSFDVDVLGWWGGGQIGFVHPAPAYFVSEPLTMVSTWDGDELSLIRVHHQLRAARHAEVEAIAHALDWALEPATDLGPVDGLGAYRVVHPKDPDRVLGCLARHGFRARAFANGAVPICPPLDSLPESFGTLRAAFEEASA